MTDIPFQDQNIQAVTNAQKAKSYMMLSPIFGNTMVRLSSSNTAATPWSMMRLRNPFSEILSCFIL